MKHVFIGIMMIVVPGMFGANLEPQTAAFIDKLAAQGGKPLYEMSVADARKTFQAVQQGPVENYDVTVEDLKVEGKTGPLSLRIVRPSNDADNLPAVMFFYGGGWILGNKDSHDRLIKHIADGARVAVIVVNYTPSPEAHYPVAIRQAYDATSYVAEHGKELNVDPSRLVVMGDSVGGNMAIAVTLLAKKLNDPKIAFQILLYPVTDARMNTASYDEFAQGPWLTKAAMKWFWDAYLPDVKARNISTVSPLQASLDELQGLPPALIITDENDVLRDEGEAYAHKLMQADVRVQAVRMLGTIHDFALLNPLANTPAPQAAISLITQTLRNVLGAK